MKTTVELPEGLLREAKRVAVRERTTVRALIERGLRTVLTHRRPAQRFVLRKASFKGDDTNILVYAHRQDADWHDPAERIVRELAEGRRMGRSVAVPS